MNTEVYRNSDVVEFYDKTSGLLPCEEVLLGRWVPQGADVLDLGVGTGRTTGFLAKQAGRYLGIDVIPEMVERCRVRFPGLDFRQGDAARLSGVADSSFNVVVFSFNGVDHLSDADRQGCFREILRVLKPAGSLIFSSHSSRYCLVYPSLHNASFFQKMWRILRAPFASLKSLKRILQRPFWRGYGAFWEEVHGGMHIYAEAPERTREMLEALGFSHVSTLPSTFPGDPGAYFVPFYYHVFTKREGA